MQRISTIDLRGAVISLFVDTLYIDILIVVDKSIDLLLF